MIGRRGSIRRTALALALLTGAAEGAADEEAGPTDRLLAALSADDAAARARASAALETVVVTPDGLDAVLGRYGVLPLEARLRVREAILALPATGPGLVRRGRAGDGVARELLEDLLHHEIARRVERDELRDPPLERGAFRTGVVVGLEWPAGPPLPLDAVVRALGRTVGSARPVHLSPAVGAPAPVEPVDLAPTTASALLERLLDARGLDVVDAGLVFLIVPCEAAAEREEQVDPKEPGDDDPFDLRDAAAPAAPPPRAVRPDAWAARHLAALLLGDGAEGARAALLDALGLSWSGDGFPAVDPRLPAEALLPWLGGDVPEEVRREVLLDVVDRGAALVPLVAALVADEDPRRRLAGAWLAAAGRVEAAFGPLGGLLGDRRRDVAVAAALARVRLRPSVAGVGGELVSTLAAGVPDSLRRDALEIAERLARAGERASAADPTPLLDASDPGARAVGAALLGADPAAGPRAVRRLAPASPEVELAFAVALARRGGPSPEVAPLLSRRGDGEAAVAWLLARSGADELLGKSWVALAEHAGARGDRLLLRALTSVAAADMAADEDYRPGRLRTALRPFRDVPATAAVVAELWSALTEEERGREVVRLGFEALPWDGPPASG